MSGSVDDEIAAYALARIIVSCVNDKQLIDRLTRYEAERVYYFLVNEEEWNQNYKLEDSGYSRLCITLANELGIQITRDRIPLTDYVELDRSPARRSVQARESSFDPGFCRDQKRGAV